MKKAIKQNKILSIVFFIMLLLIAVVSYYFIAKDNFHIHDTHIIVKQGEFYTINLSNKEKYIWTSFNPEIATVYYGKIEGKKAGITTVKVVDPNAKKSISIIVSIAETKVSSIKLTKKEVTLSVGTFETMQVEILPTGASNKALKWVSSDESVAMVDNSNIMALKEGSTLISAITTDGTNKKVEINVTVTKPKVLVSGVSLNTSIHQLAMGRTYTLTALTSPSDAKVKNLNWTSSNQYVAVVNNGTITAIDIGKATITATSIDGSNISNSMTIIIVPNVPMIDITNKVPIPYKKSFLVNYPNTNTSHLMQNFAIINQGKSNETFYFSTATRLRVSNPVMTESEKLDIVRTLIIKVPTSSLYTPSAPDIEYMYLNNTGHSQTFDIEPSGTYFWTNNKGYKYCAGSNCTWSSSNGYDCNGELCKWWGHNTAISRIKFSPNLQSDSFSPLRTYSFGTTATKGIDIQSFYDWNNDLMAVKNGLNIKVYRLSDAKEGKLTNLYSFNISASNKYVPSDSAIQGHAINGGYYYQYKGSAKEDMYIEVYNMIGELQYTKKIDPGYKAYSQEAEGIKIYDNTIYIGFIHREISSKTPVYYAIYRMQ